MKIDGKDECEHAARPDICAALREFATAHGLPFALVLFVRDDGDYHYQSFITEPIQKQVLIDGLKDYLEAMS